MSEVIATEPCTIFKLHGRNDSFKMINDDLITVILSKSNSKIKIKCKFKGIINFACKEGDEVKELDVLCVISKCTHEVLTSGICALCSAMIEITNLGDGNIMCEAGKRFAMIHSNKDLFVSEKMAMKLALDDILNLLKKRKLSLFIDLDLTILHTTSFPVSSNLKDVFHYSMKQEKNGMNSIDYHTKMRPYLKQFLERMHLKFELHIFTFGNRSYADTIREFIDPSKLLFGQRIISRDDSFNIHKKTSNLKSLFPRGDNMVCIIDDRPEVWNCVPNFIHVKPYTYFPDEEDINCPGKKDKDSILRGINNYPTKTNAKKEKTEETELPDDDDYLLTLENILNEVHARFFSEYDTLTEIFSPVEIIEKNVLPDVKPIMQEMRSEVLKGCRVSFSGLVPLNQTAQNTEAYHIMKNLGANFQQDIYLPSLDCTLDKNNGNARPYTTHLISHSDGTAKMNQVCQYIKDMNKMITSSPEALPNLTHRINLVNIYWLWHCHFLWTKVDETKYIVLPEMLQLPPPVGVSEMIFIEDEGKVSNKRRHADDDSDIDVKRTRSESEEEFMKDLDGLDDDSYDSDSGSSFDEKDWFDDDGMPKMTSGEEGLQIIDKVFIPKNKEIMNEKNKEDEVSDEEGDLKNPPKDWEDFKCSSEEEGSSEDCSDDEDDELDEKQSDGSDQEDDGSSSDLSLDFLN